MYFTKLLHLLPAAAITLAGIHAAPALAQGAGDVYVMTNQSTGNSIMLFQRDTSGALTFLATYESGGNGLGTGADPLGSQNSLVLSAGQGLLFAVNAGSNSLSVFSVFGNQLKLLNTVSSGGIMPVSVAVQHEFVYVVNAGGTPNISGFRINSTTGDLIPLAGSTQNLPGGAAASPAQVSFRPDGGSLVVTEKGTNLVDTFTLVGGVAQPGVSYTSSGTEPFGFAFGRNDIAVVSNVSGGAAGASTVASYAIGAGGQLRRISPAIGDTQTAACWLVVTGNGQFAFTTNSGSGTISSYSVAGNGDLALLNVAAATPGDVTPVDMALSADSRFLYVRDGGTGDLSAYSIGSDGSLTPLAGAAGIPSGAQGIAAY
jgi:6-phosphogluconolactonase (cycloisomerase 2 family)